ncbi:MAG: tetratricopeptide repeat protein [Planctomycetes bacterium]|nr:tetratricopeptide repeat protein [Planctomycetota bacterium]
MQRERHVEPPRSEPAPRREAPAPQAPRYDPPARRSEPQAPRYEPPVQRPQPTPEPRNYDRRAFDSTPSNPPSSSGSPSSSGDSNRRDDSARNPWSRREAPVAPPTASPSNDNGYAPERPVRRVYEDGRAPRGEDARTPQGGTSGGRLERVYDSTQPVDLSGAGRPPVVRFPVPTASPNRAPAALGSRRLAEYEKDRAANAPGSRRRLEPDVKPIPLDTPIGAGSLDRRALLDRYRDKSTLAQPGVEKRGDAIADPLPKSRRAAEKSDAGPVLDGRRRKDALANSDSPGARALDGTHRKEALEKAPVLDGTRRKEALGKAPVLDGARRKEALDKTQPSDHQRRIEAARHDAVQRAKLERLERIATTRRNVYDRMTHTGDHLARTVNTGISVGLGVTFGACTGNSVGGFWDPYNSRFECSPFTNWCSTWWWGWSAWGVPCSSWSFGYWSSHWNFWWSSSCWSPWSYRWCPYPAYYSAVVYDTYDPPPVVIYQEPAIVYVPVEAPAPAAAPAPAPAAGEGVIQPVAAPKQAPNDADASGELTKVWVDKGDAAWREGRYADAVYAYARAVDSSPDDGVYHLILADALFATGEYHYAAYSLRRALELDPDLLQTTLDKRNLYPDPTEFDKQLAVLEQYVADHPIDDEARLLLAANYLLSKKPAQCADVLESPYAVALKENAVGRLLLDRANEQRQR